MPTDQELDGMAGATVTASAKKTATKTKKAPAKVAKAATQSTKAMKQSATKAAGTARATKAAKHGRLRDAAKIAAEAQLDDGVAARAIAEAAGLHYDVEVNKRGLSVKALNKTLNARWDNGWRVAHILEQRGNTVVVYEKRQG